MEGELKNEISKIDSCSSFAVCLLQNLLGFWTFSLNCHKMICMKAQLLKYFSVAVLVFVSSFAITGCKSYCPGVDGTGNSASRNTNRAIRLGKSHCPAVSGTGNYKPKVKRKKEDGLMSAKMERQMAKAEKKKAGPIEAKKLSFD